MTSKAFTKAKLSLVMSLVAPFVLSFFPRDVLDGIWDLIGSVSGGFPTYSCNNLKKVSVHHHCADYNLEHWTQSKSKTLPPKPVLGPFCKTPLNMNCLKPSFFYLRFFCVFLAFKWIFLQIFCIFTYACRVMKWP